MRWGLLVGVRSVATNPEPPPSRNQTDMVPKVMDRDQDRVCVGFVVFMLVLFTRLPTSMASMSDLP